MSTRAFSYDDAFESLAERTERVLKLVRATAGKTCGACDGLMCGHETVFSLVAGYQDGPMCLPCLATVLERDPEPLRDQLVLFVHSKPCLTQGWRMASVLEFGAAVELPPCLWPEGGALDAIQAHEASAVPVPEADAPVDDRWDAGELGCGELVLKLRKRMSDLPSGGVLELIASDPGAPADIPAWCRMTGNPLILNEHPRYHLKRKD